MSAITVRQVTNGNVYVGGNNMMGRVTSVELPEVAFTTEDAKPLGLFGVVEQITGLDKMEATLNFEAVFKELAVQYANPKKAVALQVRSSIEEMTSEGVSAELPLVTHLRGTFKSFPLGQIEQGAKAEFSSTMAVTYIKQVFDGQDIVEIDVLANIYKVNGVDILAEYRRNLGG